MKPLNLNEIEFILSQLTSLVGGHLQEVKSSESGLALGFWAHGTRRWLGIDLRQQTPILLPFDDLPPLGPWRTRPVALFLKAHFVGKKLVGLKTARDLGRVVVFEFAEGQELELVLVPHRVNLAARTPEASISWNKPRLLQQDHQSQFADHAVSPDLKMRSLEEVREQWSAVVNLSSTEDPTGAVRSSPSLKSDTSLGLASDSKLRSDQATRAVEALIIKKNHALNRMKQDLTAKHRPWRETGEWLKTNGTLAVPSEYAECLDATESLSRNIQRAFAEAKKWEGKAAQVEQRSQMLQREIQALEVQLEQLRNQSTAQDSTILSHSKVPRSPNLEPVPNSRAKNESYLGLAKAKGRTQTLSDGSTLFVGSSGADNLRLLRKAQAWDLWLHLKDFPGCHGILRRARNQKISDAILSEAGRWVAHFSTSARRSLDEGDGFDLLLAECRYVAPIKGDKVGRVTYRNERVLRVRFANPQGVKATSSEN